MRNVNNWHWVDKNCINWTREYFTDLLVGISHETASPNIISVSISAMSELTGDVDLNQRKGKVITIFDFAVNLKWKGNFDKVEATGNIKIPEFMHDSGVEDIVFDGILI